GGTGLGPLLLVALGLWRRRAAGSLLAWVALAGCGSGTTAPSPDGAPSPAAQIVLYAVPADVEQVCTAHAHVFCGRLAECAPHRLKVRYATIEMCQARRDEACRI